MQTKPKAYMGAVNGGAERQAKEGNKTSVKAGWRDVERVEQI